MYWHKCQTEGMIEPHGAEFIDSSSPFFQTAHVPSTSLQSQTPSAAD